MVDNESKKDIVVDDDVWIGYGATILSGVHIGQACCFSAVVNVVLDFILIPYGGASAAAFTSGISALVIFVWLFVKKDSRVKLDYIWEVCEGPLVGSLLIIIICLGLKYLINDVVTLTVFSVIASTILYGLVLIIYKNEIVFDVIKTICKKGN